ncbi:lipid phosphate phosphatase 2-like isoform X3 [Juglans microcarpa x Juglans regia]|uniref:lipid phosphate phosphatase 2-like isoform X3 n=1 Tax=Juglans microcarpa x Juglans regia TaxID=2249226 RepID=UPI001B7E2D3D|nr:lipid phosphate phosphatase 2-like isoform X3 [Juglans microcarpa x Juglans regia]
MSYVHAQWWWLPDSCVPCLTCWGRGPPHTPRRKTSKKSFTRYSSLFFLKSNPINPEIVNRRSNAVIIKSIRHRFRSGVKNSASVLLNIFAFVRPMAWRDMASFLSFRKFRNTSQQRRTGEVELGTHTIRSHGATLAWNHSYDWLILLLLAVIEVVVYIIGPFHRFVGKDMMTDLKYPMKDNTVPVWSVPMYAVLLPIAIFLLFYIHRKDVYDLHHSILGLLFAVLITAVITDSIKNAVGRPRPDFFYRCFPDGKDLYDEWGGVVCHGEHSVIKEGHKSFPSGHTSWSFAGLGFLSLYLSGKLKVFDRRGHVAKLCIVFFPLLVASLIGVSRVNDYWHHWQDVFAGGVLGLAVAAFCYRQFFPPPYDDEGWGPYAYFLALKESSANTDTFQEMNVQNVQAAEIEIVSQRAGQHDDAAFSLNSGLSPTLDVMELGKR